MNRFAALMLCSALAACSGDDDAKGEPLVATTLMASYNGTTFTPVNGFATMYGDKYVVFFSDGAVHCGSETANTPPPGHTVVFSVDTLDVGLHTSFTQMFSNTGDFESIGSNTGGTLMITASTGLSLAGQASFSYTDAGNRMFTVGGTFEVLVCP